MRIEYLASECVRSARLLVASTPPPPLAYRDDALILYTMYVCFFIIILYTYFMHAREKKRPDTLGLLNEIRAVQGKARAHTSTES